jgi:hypothetical protein
MTETTHLGLPYLAAAQAQKHVTHNEALSRLDAVVQLSVIDTALTAPPGSPAEGDRYIIADGATGAWAGHDGEVAAFIDGAWVMVEAKPGWLAFDAASESVLVRHGDAWVAVGNFLGPVARFGVNTVADDTNRLAVRSNAVLLAGVDAGDGGTGDVRFMINKEGDGDTASLLFQSGFSGRAEVGLAGDTDFVFKVSADGTAWTEAIRIDKTTGRATLAADPAAAMQAATKQYVDQIIAAQDAMVFKGVIDCAAGPNYPAADRGDTYRVSVAGKIGGGSGVNVEAGDLILCLTDATASGDQAAVGANWSVAQANLDGAVIGPASATDGVPVLFDGTTGKLIKATTFGAFKTALGFLASEIPSTATGDIAATTVQGAIAELASEKAALAGSTFTGAVTVALASGSGALNLTTADPGAAGVTLTMKHDSASPLAVDIPFLFNVVANDSDGAPDTIAVFQAVYDTVTPAAEDASWVFRTMRAGARATRMTISSGLVVGNPSGGDKGTGAINAVAVYDDNVLLTCPALQDEFIKNGRIDLLKWDDMVPNQVTPGWTEMVPVTEPVTVRRREIILGPDRKPVTSDDGSFLSRVVERVEQVQVVEYVPVYDEDGLTGVDMVTLKVEEEIVHPEVVAERRHEVARLFQAMVDEGFDPRDPLNYIARLRADKALPGMPTEATWQHNTLSSGEILSRMWLAMEFLALAFIGLEARVASIESTRR